MFHLCLQSEYIRPSVSEIFAKPLLKHYETLHILKKICNQILNYLWLLSLYIYFLPRGVWALLLSGLCLLSQAWSSRPYGTLSPDVHITWTFVKASGLCFKTCLFNLWNEQSTKASYFFRGAFKSFCWTTRIIVWSESCACRRAFSAGSSCIMVAVREREGSQGVDSVWELDEPRQLR